MSERGKDLKYLDAQGTGFNNIVERNNRNNSITLKNNNLFATALAQQ